MAVHEHIPAKAILSILPPPIGIQFAGALADHVQLQVSVSRRCRRGSGLQNEDAAKRVPFRHHRFIFLSSSLSSYHRTLLRGDTSIGWIMRRFLLSTFPLWSCFQLQPFLLRAATRDATSIITDAQMGLTTSGNAALGHTLYFPLDDCALLRMHKVRISLQSRVKFSSSRER